MKSVTTEAFRRLYAAAPARRQAQIRRAYALWRANPTHPSLRFKRVHANEPSHSARVDLDWRALGVLDADPMVWFWVGSHDDYLAMLSRG